MFLMYILNQDKLQIVFLNDFSPGLYFDILLILSDISIQQLLRLLHIFSCSLSLFFDLHELNQFKQ